MLLRVLCYADVCAGLRNARWLCSVHTVSRQHDALVAVSCISSDHVWQRAVAHQVYYPLRDKDKTLDSHQSDGWEWRRVSVQTSADAYGEVRLPVLNVAQRYGRRVKGLKVLVLLLHLPRVDLVVLLCFLDAQLQRERQIVRRIQGSHK